MLAQFKVSNFKNFQREITFDFAAGDYQFNQGSVKDGLVNNAIVYGVNASGKSNLGFAVFDIVRHLTDNYYEPTFYYNYANKLDTGSAVMFSYRFKFGTDSVQYEYAKDDRSKLLKETVTINQHEVLSVQQGNKTKAEYKLAGTETLNTDIANTGISIVKYVKNNAVLTTDSNNAIFNKFYDFVNTMLFFRSVHGNRFIGLQKEGGEIGEYIIERDCVGDFEQFLNEAGIKCKLAATTYNGTKQLAFDSKGKLTLFFDIASQGAKSLALFYFWHQRLKNNNQVSLVFVDEFDAFYHHDLSQLVVEKLKETGVQFILTTHNTLIMSNDLLRPDCYYFLNDGTITPINKLTNKDLREAHDLEGLYVAGKFG